MSRSSTVGMPSSRTPPPLLGICCRFTGEGWYVPASRSSRSRAQFAHRYGSSSSVVIPSTPGLPLFFLTRFSAAFRFGRDSTFSIRGAPSLPGRSLPLAAVGASALRSPLGASPLPMNGSSSCLDICDIAPSRLERASPSFTFGPSLPASPAATTASADSSLRCSQRRPFRREARSPQVRASRHRTTAGSTPSGLGHRGFAVICPLTPLASASYPVPVRRPAVLLPASSPRSVTLPQLRFASLAMACLREDFHLQAEAHAGRTNGTAGASGAPAAA